MNSKRIFLSAPHMGENELKYIHEAFDENYIAPLGRHVDGFEQQIQDFTGAKYALALSSGTAALHLALRVLGVKDGDEVFASSLTFIGSVVPILYERCKPFFIDCDEKSWNLCPALLEQELSERAQNGKTMPKALILTHLYGQSAEIEKIADICDKYGVTLIEDAAESLGATSGGRHTGTFGKLGVYSFNGNKIITSGGGGMLVSDDKALIDFARKLSTQAREPAPHYEHETYGYNYRLSNISAAIGRGQMEVLPSRIIRRREIFDLYKKLLEGETIKFMPELPNTVGNRWLTVVTIDERTGITPEQIRLQLEKHNIECRPLWKPMHAQPLFKSAGARLNGASERLFKTGLCLPSGTAMGDDEVAMIAELVKNGVK